MTTITNNPFECGKKLKTGFDYFAKGFCKNELVDAHYRLVADRRQAQLLLECASFDDIDDFYNPGEYDDESDRLSTVTENMVLEAVRVKSFARTAQTMAALQRVLNKHLAATGKLVNDEPMFAGDAIIGKPKKSGLFASVTVQFPINDGQTLSIIFHSPDNNKMKITAADEIIAFRWLLNKRDITSAVAPDSAEEGTLPGMTAAKDVSLEEVGIRCAQLIAKNSDRFQSQQKLVIEAKQALAEVKGQVEQLQGKNAELQDNLAAQQNDADKTDAQIKATQKQLDAQVLYNEELRAKLDALKATGAGNAGKEHGEDTTGGVDKAAADADLFEEKKAAFAGELTGRGFEIIQTKQTGWLFEATYQADPKNSIIAYIQRVSNDGNYDVIAATELDKNTQDRGMFTSKTLSGLDAQITKALAWIDKKLGDMKKVEPEKVEVVNPDAGGVGPDGVELDPKANPKPEVIEPNPQAVEPDNAPEPETTNPDAAGDTTDEVSTFVATLDDILSGKYQTSDEIMPLLEQVAEEFERLALAEDSPEMKKLDQAADYMTAILDKEAA